MSEIKDFHTVGEFECWQADNGLISVSLRGGRHYKKGLLIDVSVSDGTESNLWSLEAVKEIHTPKPVENPNFDDVWPLMASLLENIQPFALALAGKTQEPVEVLKLVTVTERRTFRLQQTGKQQAGKLGQTCVYLSKTRDGGQIKAVWQDASGEGHQLDLPCGEGWLEELLAAVRKQDEPVRPLGKLGGKPGKLTSEQLDEFQAEAEDRLKRIAELRQLTR